MPLAFWVHTPHPFLIQFSENSGIRYYGLAYLLGFVGGFWLLHRYHRAGRSPFNTNAVSDLMTYIVFGVLLGGRLGYFLLYTPELLFTDPLAIFKVWDGGMSSHGGFVGVVLALALFARKQKTSFLFIGDLIVSTAPVGLFLGRIANFLNGELWGKVSDVPWAVIFEATRGGPLPRHPSQLYEAALEGLFLFAYLQWRFWKTDVVRTHPGRLSGEFLLLYAVVRMICEHFREPDASLLLGVSRGTFYSVFLIAAGLFLILRPARAKPVA
jgi:phosphatidylglycerol:prolipoprotein diacylglycerol transferase